jgi:hypothetical protein
MSLKINLIATFLMLSFASFSQKIEFPIVSMIDGDSVIIFTTTQGRKLVLINEQKNECLENLDNQSKEIKLKETVISSQEKTIKSLTEVVAQKEGIVNDVQALNNICEEEKKTLKKEVRKQKIAKWCSIGGIVVVGVLGIVF